MMSKRVRITSKMPPIISSRSWPTQPRIDSRKIAEALGAEIVGKVDGVGGGLALYVSRRAEEYERRHLEEGDSCRKAIAAMSLPRAVQPVQPEDLCPACGVLLENEHAHSRCPNCRYRDSCCF